MKPKQIVEGTFPANVLLRINSGEPLAAYQNRECKWFTVLGYGKNRVDVHYGLILSFLRSKLIMRAPYDVGYYRYRYVLTQAGIEAIIALQQVGSYQPLNQA